MRTSELLDRSKHFGRIPAIDPRDRGYLMRMELGEAPDPQDLPRWKHWMLGPILDQGQTSQCVEFAWRQMLATGPIKNIWKQTSGWLYREAQKIDEWEGESYEGTSVRAGAKVVQRERYISTYSWGEDLDDILTWVKTKGPVDMGTVWKSGMMAIDSSGFIRATGWDEGGHSYVIKGCNDNDKCPDGTRGAVTIVNSWGTAWGRRGLAKVSYVDMAKLLADWGEACTPVELRYQPLPSAQSEEFE